MGHRLIRLHYIDGCKSGRRKLEVHERQIRQCRDGTGGDTKRVEPLEERQNGMAGSDPGWTDKV